MSEWIDFEMWSNCTATARPGYIFEVVNSAGASLLTPCVVSLVLPLDWTSTPVKFRSVPEEEPKHSTPLPPSVR